MRTPWAVLKCKFNDNDVVPLPDELYRRLFTRQGTGSQNMVDYFKDCSHGELDLSDSEVFGWFTIDRPRSDYSRALEERGHAARWELVDWARSAASAGGVDLSRFFGTVICFNVLTDLFGGGRVAVCDVGSMNGSILAQEMGHGYGLDHSRMDGSTEDYRDPWDAMSTAATFMAPHGEWGYVGPGLNAWNMRGRGWLNESRVWRGSEEGFSEEIVLHPLRSLDSPGYLAAEAGNGYLVEFRMNELWDAGFGRPLVLVHRFDGNQSYLMRGRHGWLNLEAGDSFETSFSPYASYTRVDVIEINPVERIARLALSYQRGKEPELPKFGSKLLGLVAADGGGAIIVGGRIIPVPPWDPTVYLLKHAAELKAPQPWAGERVPQKAFEAIAKQMEQLLAAEMPQVPAPLTKLDKRGRRRPTRIKR